MSDEERADTFFAGGSDEEDALAAEQGVCTTDAATGSDELLVRYSQAQLARGRELLSRIYAIRRAARYYPLDHPAVKESVVALMGVARAYHGEGVDVHLSFFEGEVLLGEQLLTEESVLFDQMIRDITALGIGSIVVKRGADVDELMRAAHVLAADEELIAAKGGLTAAVEAQGLANVLIGALCVVDRATHEAVGGVEGAKATYGEAVSLLREVDRLMRLNKPASANKVKGVVRSLVDGATSNRHAMLQLTGLRNHDEYTFYHSANVAILSLSLGSLISQDYRFLSSLGTGALLHDIGKLSVDAEIINKPGTLTAEEWANMRLHPVTGAEIAARIPGIDKSAIVMILEHHMRTDGSGYPERTVKRPQHLASRIVSVADAYDAMTSRRSYSAARVQDEAMSLLVRSAGVSLDAALVRLFVRMMGVYPARSAVRLSDGRIGVVVSPSLTDPVRPLVRVVADASCARIAPLDIDLTVDRDVSISACIDPRMLNFDVDLFV